MDYQLLTHGFGPAYDPGSRLLILGSCPSAKSREQGFYYGHPQNRFWRVLAAVFEDETPGTVAQKRAFLQKHGVALYDVIEQCEILGSSDASIRAVVPTELRPILSGSQIGDRVFVNGGKAFELYRRYQLPLTGVPAIRLPSTSPANAAWSLPRLTEAWKTAIENKLY